MDIIQTLPTIGVQIDTTDSTTTTILAMDYTLRQSDAPGEKNLTIYADTLTIPAGTYSYPEKNIIIYARVLNSDGEVTLDVSGKPGKSQPTPKPLTPAQAGAGQPGTLGTYGAGGDDGTNAGSIELNVNAINCQIILKAQGGAGGDGQDGGDGGQGGQGADGGNDYSCEQRDGSDGHQGAMGGEGGNPGQSGKGGDGGVIIVNTIQALTNNQVQPFSKGGGGGRTTNGGYGGPGGGGGRGGNRSGYGRVVPGVKYPPCVIVGNYNNGQQGNKGVDVHFRNLTGAPGGDRTWQYGQADINNLTPTVNDNMLTLVQRTMIYAEAKYLSGDIGGASTYYNWVYACTKNATADSDDGITYQNISVQCSRLLDQINRGLDFFGNTYDYIPLVSLDVYTDAVTAMLQTGSHMETLQTLLATYNSSTTNRTADLDSQISAVNDWITQATKQSANLLLQLNGDATHLGLSKAIDQATTELAAKYSELWNASDDFKAAMQQEANGCKFDDLLTLAKGIVSVGKDAYTAYGAPTPGNAGAFLKDAGALGMDIKKMVDKIKATEADEATLKASWDSMNADDADNKLLATERDEFDKMIGKYLGNAKAAQYKRVMHDYIGAIQARNAMKLQYTSSVAEYMSLQAKMAGKQADLSRLNNLKQAGTIPNVFSYLTALQKNYWDYLVTCAKYLYQEHRAYLYWSLSDTPFVISDLSFSGLSVIHSTTIQNILDTLNAAAGTDTVEFTDGKTVVVANSEIEDGAARIADFKQNYSVTFSINEEDGYFTGYVGVMLDKFSVAIDGVTLTSDLNVTLLHNGYVYVRDLQGNLHYYQHSPIPRTVIIKQGDNVSPDTDYGNVLTESAKLIWVSPYASFTLSIPADSRQGLDLTNLSNISVTFKGSGVKTTSTHAHHQRKAVAEAV